MVHSWQQMLNGLLIVSLELHLRVLNSTIWVSLASSKIPRKTYNIVAKPANIWKIKVSTPPNWIIFVFFPNSQQVTDETVIWSIIVWWSVTSTNYDWFFKRFYFNRYNITSNEFKMVFLTIKCFLYITLLLHIQHYNHYEELYNF